MKIYSKKLGELSVRIEIVLLICKDEYYYHVTVRHVGCKGVILGKSCIPMLPVTMEDTQRTESERKSMVVRRAVRAAERNYDKLIQAVITR